VGDRVPPPSSHGVAPAGFDPYLLELAVIEHAGRYEDQPGDES
jgi:hypothetical protein